MRRVSRRKRGETQPSGGSEGDGRMKVRRSPSTSVTRRSYRESSPFPPLSVIYPLLSSGRRSFLTQGLVSRSERRERESDAGKDGDMEAVNLSFSFRTPSIS